MHMKIRRFLSGLLFGLGVVVVFFGVLAVILPKLNNPQLALFLNSFETPSRLAIVNLINRFFQLVLQYSWQALSIGALCVVLGVALAGRTDEDEEAFEEPEDCYQRPVIEVAPPIEEEPALYDTFEEPEINPFAANEPANPFAVDLLSYHKPILEENRIDENRPHLPSSFAGEAIAIVTESGAQSPSGARTILRTPQPIAAPSAPVSPVIPEPAIPDIPSEQHPQPASDPVPSLQPAPSRIRSTMGQHRQW